MSALEWLDVLQVIYKAPVAHGRGELPCSGNGEFQEYALDSARASHKEAGNGLETCKGTSNRVDGANGVIGSA